MAAHITDDNHQDTAERIYPTATSDDWAADPVNTPYSTATKNTTKDKGDKGKSKVILVNVLAGLQIVCAILSAVFLAVGLYKLRDYEPITITSNETESGSEIDKDISKPPKGFFIASLVFLVASLVLYGVCMVLTIMGRRSKTRVKST